VATVGKRLFLYDFARESAEAIAALPLKSAPALAFSLILTSLPKAGLNLSLNA
jgi:hypothetical protein